MVRGRTERDGLDALGCLGPRDGLDSVREWGPGTGLGPRDGLWGPGCDRACRWSAAAQGAWVVMEKGRLLRLLLQ